MKRACVVLVLLLTAPSAVLAWGANGHRIVGRIAMNHLTDEAARAVQCLIGPEGLDQVSTWPDEIRTDPRWKKADPWHFLDVDDNQALETVQRDPNGDVLEAIQRFTAVLRDPQASRESKQEALKFLVHFVGDVHQPLHVGRHADQGGNTIKVTFFKAETSLHSVWDSGLIDNEKLSFSEFASFIDHPTLQEIQAWQSSAPADWAKESQAMRSRVYATGDGKLSYEYVYVEIPLVKQRLLQAGVRLAGLLSSIFAEAGSSIPDRTLSAAPNNP